MRVAVIIDKLGAYHEARMRAAAQVSELTVIQISARSAEYAWENEAQGDTFHLVTLLTHGVGRDQPGREIARRMGAALNKARPEVVFIPGWFAHEAHAALLWCHRHHIPAVVMSESTAWDEGRTGWKEAIKRRVVSLFAAALVGGKAHAAYLSQLGLQPDRIFQGYDVVDNAYFWQASRIRAEGEAGPASHGLPRAYFLASARFIPKKNLSGLIAAYARYVSLCSKTDFEPWALVLLGDGELRGALEKQIAKENLQSRVFLPGFKQYPDLLHYYARASAFVHASLIEPWGLVVNEAMASSLPVLVSDRCGCAGDLVQSGRNGFTFDPQHEEEVASLLHKISRLPEAQRQALGAESASIIAEWCPERFAQGFLASAQSALEKGSFRKGGWLDRMLLRGLLWR